MRRYISLLVAVFCVTTGPAMAATFDGKWQADIPAQGRCNFTSLMSIMVLGSDIQGQIQNPGNKVGVVGNLDADGTGTIVVANVSHGTIKFTGDRFNATWQNNECARNAEGDRAPSDDAVAALAAARPAHQAAFADLVRRAQAGEKIDFAALRAESVYAPDWDFYDSKISNMVTQADAAAKGKDCATALDLTAQLLKIDFLVDSAHSIRSDCLEDSDRAASRIEEGIADGLIHSLMDSGDGDTEKTAYKVATLREEMDVLANRHIQIKARQTTIRGSDGHYYDQIQGISVRNSDVRALTVYFDVSSYVAGQDSRRAAVTIAQASVH
jgi:hypothetical protein